MQKSSQPNQAPMENLSCCRYTSISLHLRPKAVKQAKRVLDLYILLEAKVLINPTEQYLASCLSRLPFGTLQVTLLSHPMGEGGCELRPELHHTLMNIISNVTELTQPLQTGKYLK